MTVAAIASYKEPNKISPQMVRGGGVFTLIPFLLLLCALRQCDAANILVLEGVPSPSHHLWMRTLSSELVRHGHNVTSLSCDVDENPPANLTYLHLEQTYATLYGGVAAAADDAAAPMDVFLYGELGTWTKLLMARFWQLGMFRGAIKSEGFQRLLDYPDDFPFDLIIYDTITTPAMMAFVDKFKSAPVISVTPFPVIYASNHISGSVYLPAFVPNQNLAKIETSFLARLNNFLLTYVEHYYMAVHLGGIIKSELADRVTMTGSIEEMYAKTRLLMPNYNPAVNLVQPLMPMVIPVGGLQISAVKPLPTDLAELFDKAPVGVVYFSLGTNIQSEQLGTHRLTEIIEAFRALPEYTFLWKINITGLDAAQTLPANVHVRQWLPQNDILAHNKTLLFISHGGGLSTQETTWFGVPMLGVPIFLDQHPNVNLAVAAGMALNLDLKSINRKTFTEAMLEMLTNSSYRRNAQLRSKNFQDQKEHPLQRAMWWIDYVLRNQDISFLKHPSLAQLNVCTKHSIDIIAFLVVLVIAFAGLFCLTIRWCLRRKRSTTAIGQHRQSKAKFQ